MTDALWIDRPEALAAAIARWRAAPGPRVIGLDTEFVFERTFRPQLGLVQVAAGTEIALVDAGRMPDLTPLAPLLDDPAVRKVLHSGSGDVPILRRATGTVPRPLFDTQIAAAYAGLGISISYAALVQVLFGEELPKDATRTDWLRRPLSPVQLRYAAEDVTRLADAAAELERRLRELGRLEWALEDAATLVEADRDGVDPESAWRRVKGIDRLPPEPRAVARALAAWREREAERLDLARSFLLRDETLLLLARRTDPDRAELAKLAGYEARRHAQHLPGWAAALTAAHADAAAGKAPPEPAVQRLSGEVRAKRKRLEEAITELVSRRATELALPPELLLSRRQRDRALTAWGGKGALSAHLGGYRGELFGADLDRLVDSTR